MNLCKRLRGTALCQKSREGLSTVAPICKTEEEIWTERYDALAVKVDADALLKQEEVIGRREQTLLEYQEEFQFDSSGYVFECRRWGDFLSLFIERKWYWERGNKTPRTYAGSINLTQSKEIRLIEGRSPDCLGTVRYYAQYYGGDGEDYRGVEAKYPPGQSRNLFDLKLSDTEEQRFYGIPDEYNRRYYKDHYSRVSPPRPNTTLVTEGFPRLAMDDRIWFLGPQGTLFIPAGMGRKVYDQILTEIGRGYKVYSNE